MTKRHTDKAFTLLIKCDLALVVEFLIKKEYNTQNLNTMKNSAVYDGNFNSNARLRIIYSQLKFVLSLDRARVYGLYVFIWFLQ